MSTLIISTFNSTFEEFKENFTNYFIAEKFKEFFTNYEFVKVNNNKSNLLMNNYSEKLGAVIESPFVKVWDKKNNCKDTIFSIEIAR